MRGSLYDNYRQQNSSYVSQFVGSIVPEVASFAGNMRNRYNEARDQDDILYEALGNMTHLDNEEDSVYASELKQQYADRLIQRTEKGDYENMGRRVKADARAFVQEYAPLQNRMQAMSQIQQRVLSDDKVFDPAKREQILGYIKDRNKLKKNPDGTFQRDANGRIKLGTISDWNYAKDVDIDKKVKDMLKDVEAELKQSGFVPDGNGLLISATKETRTKEDMYRMALARMENDPEIKAYLNREEELATYHLKGEVLGAVANRQNISEYERMASIYKDKKVLSEKIKEKGIPIEELKKKPLDMIVESYQQRGLPVENAYRDFLKRNVREGLKGQHADFVSNVLKIDKTKVDVRNDINYELALKAQYDRQLADYNRAIDQNAQIVPTYTDDTADQESADYISLQQSNQEAQQAYSGAVAISKAGIKNILKGVVQVPGDNASPEEARKWSNFTGELLNNPEKQQQLLGTIKDMSKRNELQGLFDQHRTAKNKVIEISQKADAIPNSVYSEAVEYGWKKYKEYERKGGKKLYKTEEEFSNAMIEKARSGNVGKGYFGIGYREQGKGFFGGDMKVFEDTFFSKLDEGTKNAVSNIRSRINVFVDSGSGVVARNNALATNLARTNASGFSDSRGNSLSKILEKQFDDLGLDEKEKSAYFRDAMDAKMITSLSSNGRSQYVIRLPDGSTKTFEHAGLSPAASKEALIRMVKGTATNYSSDEYKYQLDNISASMGESTLKYTNRIDLDNSPKGSTVDLNDKYAFRITNSKNGSSWGTPTMGKLLVKDGNSYKEAGKEFNNMTVEDVMKALGMEEFQRSAR